MCGGGGGVTLMPVDCAPAMVGVDAAFAGAIMGNCGCHGGGAGGQKLLAAAAKRESGRRIDHITEQWFMRLVGVPA